MLLAGLAAVVAAPLLAGCGGGDSGVTLHWYVGQETSGSYREAAQRCTDASAGRYRIALEPLPRNADAQRQLVVRRLAARDRTVDLIGMDVIWTAEFAEAGWLRPWVGARAAQVSTGVLAGPLATARYRGVLWAAPFTSNTQLLWYRKSRTGTVPSTWDELITAAEALPRGQQEVAVQGGRYEGYTVWVTALLASAGTELVADADRPDRARAGLAPGPTEQALGVIRRLATSPVADPGLSVATEQDTRDAMLSGTASYSLNYPALYAAARAETPGLLDDLGWARYPAVVAGRPCPAAAGRDQPRRERVLAASGAGLRRRRLPARRGQPGARRHPGRPAADDRRRVRRPGGASGSSRSAGCCASRSRPRRRGRRPRRTATCRSPCSRCCTRRPRSTRPGTCPSCAARSTTRSPPRRCCEATGDEHAGDPAALGTAAPERSDPGADRWAL